MSAIDRIVEDYKTVEPEGYVRYWLSPTGAPIKVASHEPYIRAELNLGSSMPTSEIYQAAFNHGWCRVVIEPSRIWFECNRNFAVPPKPTQLRWLRDEAIERKLPLVNGFNNQQVCLESLKDLA